MNTVLCVKSISKINVGVHFRWMLCENCLKQKRCLIGLHRNRKFRGIIPVRELMFQQILPAKMKIKVTNIRIYGRKLLNVMSDSSH